MFGGSSMLGFHCAQRSAGHRSVSWLGSATRPPAGREFQNQGSWTNQGSAVKAGGCAGGGTLGPAPFGVISEGCGWPMPFDTFKHQVGGILSVLCGHEHAVEVDAAKGGPRGRIAGGAGDFRIIPFVALGNSPGKAEEA